MQDLEEGVKGVMIEKSGFSGGTGGTKSCDLAKSAIHFFLHYFSHPRTPISKQVSENQNNAINNVVLNRQVESHAQNRVIVVCHSGRQTDRKVMPQHGTHV